MLSKCQPLLNATQMSQEILGDNVEMILLQESVSGQLKRMGP